MSIYIVTDLGYGDAGKGTTTDFLARQGKSLVIRHNGGPQAGHNVVRPKGVHHEFSQFGSGTFEGADTYLSKYMLINPADMRRERSALYKLHVLGDDPYNHLHVDEECRIITPWHIALNRMMAYSRGESCGRGIGELMRQDIDHPELTIRVKDIRRTGLVRKLEALRAYMASYSKRIERLVWKTEGSKTTPCGAEHEWDVLTNLDLVRQLAHTYYNWYDEVNVVGGQWLGDHDFNYKNLIFEGAQGVLLDEWYGFHPYTTWSTTTHENALSILAEQGIDQPVVRLGVTRAYMTRHGAGPFVTEDPHVKHDEPYNTTGDFQGHFRQGHLDIVALRYAIEVCGGVDGLVVTHLDRSNYWAVASAYQTEHFGRIGRIQVNPNREDLKWQGQLTEALMKARPTLVSPAVSTEGVLATLSNIAPIHITSRGPTYKDKSWEAEA